MGDGFLRVKWPNRQCQSTEGRDSSKKRLQSHQVHLTMLQYYTCMQYTIIQKTHTYIHKNRSKHSETGPVRQNPIQRSVRCVHMCVHCAQLLRTILHRIDLIIFPLTLQTIIIAPMMSIWGKGGTQYFSKNIIVSFTVRQTSVSQPLFQDNRGKLAPERLN